MTDKSDADILAEAREYVVDHGWTPNVMRDGDGHVCTLGAIVCSQYWYGEDHEDWECSREFISDLRRLGQKLLRALGVTEEYALNDGLSPIAKWNDEMVENGQQVIDLFAKAEKIELAGFDPDEGVVV